MKLTIYLICLIGLLLFLSRPTISFEPFSIKFEKLWSSIGYILIILGIIFIEIQGDIEKEEIKKEKQIFFDFEKK